MNQSTRYNLNKGSLTMHQFPPGLTWFNVEKPLKTVDLVGKVVLVDFWTYSCINCIRMIPFLKYWYDTYNKYGFEIIGIHAPEFGFEKDSLNVENAIKNYEIPYPVVLDNNHRLWTVYDNRYWPAHYLHDAIGKLRYTHFGEGEYEKTEQMIRKLLEEKGVKIEEPMVPIKVPVDFTKIGSSETYLGYGRMVGFASPEELKHNIPQYYSISPEIKKNRVYFEGMWKVDIDKSTLEKPEGKIAYRYSANKINLVMGSSHPVKALVLIDGEKLQIGNKGDDIDENGYLNIQEYKLYNLINTHNYYEVHTCEIIFFDAGVEVFAFTFG